jgi:hypothetical protein
MGERSSESSRVSRIVLALVFGMSLCFAICVATVIIRCRLLNIPREAPIYPQSTLVDQVSDGVGTSRRPILTYHYTSTDSPESIVAFYEERGYCRENEGYNRVTCRGRATPSGEFFAYIDLAAYEDQGITSYVVEVRWRGCTWRLE